MEGLRNHVYIYCSIFRTTSNLDISKLHLMDSISVILLHGEISTMTNRAMMLCKDEFTHSTQLINYNNFARFFIQSIVAVARWFNSLLGQIKQLQLRSLKRGRYCTVVSIYGPI